MPALTMRGRYLMREYWGDSDLFLRLDSSQREVYQGLWMLADDEGWMPRDVPAIAASLYRYEDREPREARVKSALGRLSDLGKVLSHRCCLYIPAVVAYPRPGKKTREHLIEHQRHQNAKSVQTHSNRFESSIQTDSNPSPVPTRPNPNVAGARDPAGAAPALSEFSAKVPRPS